MYLLGNGHHIEWTRVRLVGPGYTMKKKPEWKPRHIKALVYWDALNMFLLTANAHDCDVVAHLELMQKNRPSFLHRIKGRARVAAKIKHRRGLL